MLNTHHVMTADWSLIGSDALSAHCLDSPPSVCDVFTAAFLCDNHRPHLNISPRSPRWVFMRAMAGNDEHKQQQETHYMHGCFVNTVAHRCLYLCFLCRLCRVTGMRLPRCHCLSSLLRAFFILLIFFSSLLIEYPLLCSLLLNDKQNGGRLWRPLSSLCLFRCRCLVLSLFVYLHF